MVKRMLALALALALILSVSTVFASGIGTAATYGTDPYTPETYQTMYVYTDNGQGLNVRSTPYVGNNIIDGADEIIGTTELYAGAQDL